MPAVEAKHAGTRWLIAAALAEAVREWLVHGDLRGEIVIEIGPVPQLL
jgi:hypothetical protein